MFRLDLFRCSWVIPAVLAGLMGSALAQPCIHPDTSEEFPLVGDVNGSGALNVADVMCVLETAVWESAGGVGSLPTCIADAYEFADLTCDSAVDVSDIVASITLVLYGSLPAAVDTLGRGCYDACAPPPIPGGTLDLAFNSGNGIDDQEIRQLEILADGDIVAGGNFHAYAGASRNGIAGIKADGALDSGFDPGTGTGTSGVRGMAVQSNGRIVIGGAFTEYDGTARHRVARLMPNGSLDGSFHPGAGANSSVEGVHLFADERILVCGPFTEFAGQPRNGAAILTASGALDASFVPPSGNNGYIYRCAILADGSVLLGGTFTSFGGQSRGRIAKLNADGSLNTNFPVSGGFDANVRGIRPRPDGSFWIVGAFDNYAGTPRGGVARFLADGTLDPTFETPLGGAIGNVLSLAEQADGKLVLVGGFSQFNGVSVPRMARIHPDGSLDTAFMTAIGTGPNAHMYDVKLQPDGAIVIGGYFHEFDGASRERIVRLSGN